ncbi:MAG: AzlD domain-containing protein [Agathobacter rectalis]
MIAAVAGTIFLQDSARFYSFPPWKTDPAGDTVSGSACRAVIGMLGIYCLKAVLSYPIHMDLPEFIAVAVVILLHVWKRNNLRSVSASGQCSLYGVDTGCI